jgi:hypothetical protein
MILYDYKPNGHGPQEFFHYSGNIHEVKNISSLISAGVVNGWLVRCWSLWFKRLRFVFFGKNDKIYVHTPDGIFCCSSDDIRCSCHKVLNFLFVAFSGAKEGEVRYVIQIPLSRFLANDGMFPSEVEPLYDILTRLSDPFEKARLAKMLSKGVPLASGLKPE